VNLRYHKSDLTLKCHLCGFEQKAPEVCPGCGGEQLKFKGTGIQKAEELIQEMFPQARIIRMDQDSTRRKGAHVALLGQFARREADILLGTQMVAKGLNFPGVALVGVLQADTGLHFPDFRASERTFQLLSQVAGRAGRSDDLGEVVIQTYFPEETAIEAAKRHDYHFFYDSEIEHRNELGYPPFGKVTRIVFEGTDESYGFSKINQFANHLQSLAIPQLQVLGPTPAVLARVDNFYRYSLLLKSPTPKAISAAVDLLSKNAAHYLAKIRCIVDIDAVNML
jgi:primosomal protein N' (replication factor Y)